MYLLLVSVRRSDGSAPTFGVTCKCQSHRDEAIKKLKEHYSDVQVKFFGECFEHDYSYEEVMNEYKIAG